MNSLQLVSKIRSKADDLSQNITDLLGAGHPFSGLDKELLKKQCLDLYEMVLKLKAEEEQTLPTSVQNTPVYHTPPPAPEIREIIAEPIIPETPKLEEPLIQADNFQEVIEWADKNEETLDELVHKVELKEELPPMPEKPVVHILEEDLPEPKPLVTEIPSHPGPEINIGKAIENKRIQYTVMPDITEPKPLGLNSNFKDKEPTYNDKIAQTNPPVAIPLADKTIEAPIDNIKAAINLNKKIAFVNELFKENVVEYAKAIDRLNNAGDLNDALRIHNELKHLYSWENSHELVQDLERLIKRRFA